MLPWQEVNSGYPTASHLCSSRRIFNNLLEYKGAPVQHHSVPEMGCVFIETGTI